MFTEKSKKKREPTVTALPAKSLAAEGMILLIFVISSSIKPSLFRDPE